jgi:hypothetical protein
MIISIPLNTKIARILKKIQEQQMKNRDRRMRLASLLIKRFVTSCRRLILMIEL